MFQATDRIRYMQGRQKKLARLLEAYEGNRKEKSVFERDNNL